MVANDTDGFVLAWNTFWGNEVPTIQTAAGGQLRIVLQWIRGQGVYGYIALDRPEEKQRRRVILCATTIKSLMHGA